MKRKIFKESESKREFDREEKKREAREHSSELRTIYVYYLVYSVPGVPFRSEVG